MHVVRDYELAPSPVDRCVADEQLATVAAVDGIEQVRVWRELEPLMSQPHPLRERRAVSGLELHDHDGASIVVDAERAELGRAMSPARPLQVRITCHATTIALPRAAARRCYSRLMSELPPPDLLDQGGRARRLVLAALAGGATAAAVYGLTYQLSDPEHQATTGAFRFVFYMTAFAGAAVFVATLKILDWRANKKYRAQLVAQAKVRKT